MPRASTDTARAAAARALAHAAGQFPDIHPEPSEVGSLGPADRRLAVAIHRAALQRWITIEYLLDRRLKPPMRMATIEPALRGVLLSAGAQLLCFDRLPAHAVVDESVELARVMVRRKAAGLVNAVLRRLCDDIAERQHDQPWYPGADRLPLEAGSIILAGDLMPDASDLPRYLSAATSHPQPLIARWIDELGDSKAANVAAHGTFTPLTTVFDQTGRCFAWQDESLTDWLAAHPLRRVQDAGSAEPLGLTESLQPRTIIDYCAGRGTKTRQACAMHPEARLFAHDVDTDRLASLRDVVDRIDNAAMLDDGVTPCDLLVLDVPCSNSGTFARRPEARYRFNDRTLQSLVALQRRIMEQAVGRVRAGGHVLYATCSLEPEENAEQARYLADRCGGAIEAEKLTLPAGPGEAYRDGSYAALVAVG